MHDPDVQEALVKELFHKLHVATTTEPADNGRTALGGPYWPGTRPGDDVTGATSERTKAAVEYLVRLQEETHADNPDARLTSTDLRNNLLKNGFADAITGFAIDHTISAKTKDYDTFDGMKPGFESLVKAHLRKEGVEEGSEEWDDYLERAKKSEFHHKAGGLKSDGEFDKFAIGAVHLHNMALLQGQQNSVHQHRLPLEKLFLQPSIRAAAKALAASMKYGNLQAVPVPGNELWKDNLLNNRVVKEGGRRDDLSEYDAYRLLIHAINDHPIWQDTEALRKLGFDTSAATKSGRPDLRCHANKEAYAKFLAMQLVDPTPAPSEDPTKRAPRTPGAKKSHEDPTTPSTPTPAIDKSEGRGRRHKKDGSPDTSATPPPAPSQHSDTTPKKDDSSALHYKKDGSLDMRYASSKAAAATTVVSAKSVPAPSQGSDTARKIDDSSALHYKKDGTLDMRYASSKAAVSQSSYSTYYPAPALAPAAPVYAPVSTSSSLHYKKDGTLDMRYASSRAAMGYY